MKVISSFDRVEAWGLSSLCKDIFFFCWGLVFGVRPFLLYHGSGFHLPQP